MNIESSWYLVVHSFFLWYTKVRLKTASDCKIFFSHIQKISKVFWLVTNYVESCKSPNPSNPYTIKAECLKSGFCALKASKKLKIEELGARKMILKVKEMESKQFLLKIKLLCVVFLFFYFEVVAYANNVEYLKLLIILYYILKVAYKLVAYKKVCIAVI